MNISTIGGFSFLGKRVENNKLDILLVNVDREATADLSNKQSKRIITVTLGIYGKTAIERRQKLRILLQDWLKNKGPLRFDDDEGICYEAKLVDKTPVTDLNAHLDGITLVFECDRNLYGITEKSLTGTTISTRNEGNELADTLFICTANCTVTLGSQSFTLTNVTNTVYVDSKRMVVYEVVNGKEVNKATDYTCNSPEYFLKLEPNQALTITSTSNIQVKFRDTYMV